jgi:hypothetical protein
MSNETPAPQGAESQPVAAPDQATVNGGERAAVVDKNTEAAPQPVPLVEPAGATSRAGETPSDAGAANTVDEHAAATRHTATTPASESAATTSEEPPPRAATSAASMQTVYVPAPVPPRKRGNRGFGMLIALLSTAIFAGLYALIIATVRAVQTGVFEFNFFGSIAFYTPALFFFVGFAIVVLLANRASWWGYVLGSLFVGLVVYFGTVATGLLVNNVVGETPTGAARLLSTALTSPFIIAAALLAREVSMWMGAAISARGRRVKGRNVEARDTFDRESADRATELENSRYGTRDATV